MSKKANANAYDAGYNAGYREAVIAVARYLRAKEIGAKKMEEWQRGLDEAAAKLGADHPAVAALKATAPEIESDLQEVSLFEAVLATGEVPVAKEAPLPLESGVVEIDPDLPAEEAITVN